MSSLTTRLASYWYGGETPSATAAQHSVVAALPGVQDRRRLRGRRRLGRAATAWPRVLRGDRAHGPRRPSRLRRQRPRVANRDALNAILDPIFADADDRGLARPVPRRRALFGPIFTRPRGRRAGAGRPRRLRDHHRACRRSGAIPQLRPAIEMADTPGEIAVPAAAARRAQRRDPGRARLRRRRDRRAGRRRRILLVTAPDQPVAA